MLKKVQTWIDKITTGVASILIGIMFLVIILNVIMRAIPSVGGFRWAMEFSQYANVWAMLIGAAGIAVQGTNLRVEAVDSLAKKIPYGDKITKILIDIALIVFYCILFRSGKMISKRAIQTLGTMPRFRMGQVYAIFPATSVMCIISAVVHMLVTLTEKESDGSAMEKVEKEYEGEGAE
ncbi:MAG: TRAP transporter small permease subunit [Anaerolineaceae bacterium]|nr:TRAP transporter small permease subunit [Anaerolineaceae bacterium]